MQECPYYELERMHKAGRCIFFRPIKPQNWLQFNHKGKPVYVTGYALGEECLLEDREKMKPFYYIDAPVELDKVFSN